MKKLVVATLSGLALLQAALAVAEDRPGKILITEETIRTVSAHIYANLLSQAYEKGWRYPKHQIESGFRRHFDELKQQLIAQGFTIIPTEEREVDIPSKVGREL